MTAPRNDNARGQAGEVGTASVQAKLNGGAKVQDAEGVRKYIACALIRLDGDTQPRAEINLETVADYAEAVAEQAPFPPVVVFNDGASLWLADGFHRVHAHRKAGMATIFAEVRPGTRRDAVLHGFIANTRHGLRETRADKRRKVEMMLRDEEWVMWSDREIARRCGVHHETVGSVRAEMVGRGEIRHVDTRTDAAGRQQPAGKANQIPAASSEIPRIAFRATDPAPTPCVEVEPAPPLEDEPTEAPAPDPVVMAAPSASPATTKPEPAADGEVVALRAEVEDLREHLAELSRNLEDVLAENESLHRTLAKEGDERIAAALAEAKREREHARILSERIHGLTGEKAEAIKAAKRWQRKAEQAGRCA